MSDTPTGRAAVFTLDYLNVLILSANWKLLYAKNKGINCHNLTRKEQKNHFFIQRSNVSSNHFLV